MSQENVEVVRRAMAAFNARDRDRALSICDPEIELWSPFEQKTHRGLDEMVQWRDDLAAAMQDFHMEDSRVLDAGGDREVVLYRRVGRGAGSGVPVSRDLGALWQSRNGKLLKGEIYLDSRKPSKPPGFRSRADPVSLETASRLTVPLRPLKKCHAGGLRASPLSP